MGALQLGFVVLPYLAALTCSIRSDRTLHPLVSVQLTGFL